MDARRESESPEARGLWFRHNFCEKMISPPFHDIIALNGLIHTFAPGLVGATQKSVKVYVQKPVKGDQKVNLGKEKE